MTADDGGRGRACVCRSFRNKQRWSLGCGFLKWFAGVIVERRGDHSAEEQGVGGAEAGLPAPRNSVLR